MCPWQKRSLREEKGNKSLKKKKTLKKKGFPDVYTTLILLLKIIVGGKFGEVRCKVKVSSRKNWNFATTDI